MYNGVYTAEQYAYIHDTLMKWINIKVEGGNLGNRIKALGISDVAVYGANDLGQMVCRDIEKDITVHAYVDRNAQRFQGGINGKQVLTPEQVSILPEECFILVTPEYYFLEIMNDLTQCGIDIQRIISLSMVV